MPIKTEQLRPILIQTGRGRVFLSPELDPFVPKLNRTGSKYWIRIIFDHWNK